MSTCKNIDTISDEICTYICDKYYSFGGSDYDTCKSVCKTEIIKELNPFTLKDRLFGYHLDKIDVTETEDSYEEVGNLINTESDKLNELIDGMTYQELLNDKYCEIQTGIKWKAYNLLNDGQKTELLSNFRKYSSFGLKWEKIENEDIGSLPLFNLPAYPNFNTIFADKINPVQPANITFTLSDLYIDDVYEHILPNSYIEYTVAGAGAGAIYYKVKAYDLSIFNQSTLDKFTSVDVVSGTATVTLTNNDIDNIDKDVITNGFKYSDFILDSNIVYIPIIGCNEYSGYSCDTIQTTLGDNCYIAYDSAIHVLREENISDMLNNGLCTDSILKMHNTNNLYTKINKIFNNPTINTSLGNMMGLNITDKNNDDVVDINSQIDTIIEGMDDDFFSIDDFIRLSTLDLQYWKIESGSIATAFYDKLTINAELTKLHGALQEKLNDKTEIDDLIILEKNQFSDSEWQSLIINNIKQISNAHYIKIGSTFLIPYIPLHDFYYKRGNDVFSKCLKYEDVPDEVNTIKIKNYDSAVLGSFKKIGSDVGTYSDLIDASDLIEKNQCDTEKIELIEKETNKYLYNYINNVNNCRVDSSQFDELDAKKTSYDTYKSYLSTYNDGALKNITNSDFSNLKKYDTLKNKFNNGDVNNKFDNYYNYIDGRGECKYTDEYYYNDNSCEDESYGDCRYIVDENDANGPLPTDTSSTATSITLRQMQLTGSEIDKIAVNNTILTNLGSEKLGQLEDNIEEYKKDTYSNKKTRILNASKWKKYSQLTEAPDYVYSTELLSENIGNTDIDSIINDASIIDSLTDADYDTLKTELINELKTKLESGTSDGNSLINVSNPSITLSKDGNTIKTVNFNDIIQTLFDNNKLDKDVYIKDDTPNYYFLNLEFGECNVDSVQYSSCLPSESCQYVDDYTNSIAKISGGDSECAYYLTYTGNCEHYKTSKNIINKSINYNKCIDYFKDGISLSGTSGTGQPYTISYNGGHTLSIDPPPSEIDSDTTDNVIAKFENDVYTNCEYIDYDMNRNTYIEYNANDYTCATEVEETCPNSEVDTSTNRVGEDKCIASIGYYKNIDQTGAVTYQPCAQGLTTAGIGMTSANDCTTLKEGYSYSSGTANKCLEGTYREDDFDITSATTTVSCDTCDTYKEGTTTDGDGKTEATDCNIASVGYYKHTDGGGSTYQPCPDGLTTDGDGKTLASDCDILKAGYSYSYSSGTATKCEPGTYRTGDESTDTDKTCETCPLGLTTNGDGKTDVSDCDKLVKGYYESASGTYTECPAGFTTELNSDETAFVRDCDSNDASCCDMVAAGYSYDSTYGSVDPCSVGTYRAGDQKFAETDINCSGCTLGSTTEDVGMTSETQCNVASKGYYKNADEYLSCPDGLTTADTIHATSQTDCNHVKAGYYINGSSYEECRIGTYSLDRPMGDTPASQCIACPPGLTTDSSGADSESLCNIIDTTSIQNIISSPGGAGSGADSGSDSGGGGADSGADSGGGGIIQSGDSDFTTLQSELESQISGGIPNKGTITIGSTDGSSPDQEYIFIASAGDVIAFIPVNNLIAGYEYDDTTVGEIFKCKNGYKKVDNICTICNEREKCIDGTVEIECPFNSFFDYEGEDPDCENDDACGQVSPAGSGIYHIQIGKGCLESDLSDTASNPKCPEGTYLNIDKNNDFYGYCVACPPGHKQNLLGLNCETCDADEKTYPTGRQDSFGTPIYECELCNNWEKPGTADQATLETSCEPLSNNEKWYISIIGNKSVVPLDTNEIKAGHAHYGSADIPENSYIKGFIITYTSDVTGISPEINYNSHTSVAETTQSPLSVFPSYMPKFQNFLDNNNNTNYIFFELVDGNLKLNNLNYIKYNDTASIDKIKEIIVVVNKEAYDASAVENESKFMYYLLTNTVNKIIYAQNGTGEYIGHDEQNDMLTDRQRYAIHHGTSTKYNYIQRQPGSGSSGSSGTVIKLQQTNTDDTPIEIAVNIQDADMSHHTGKDLNIKYSVGSPSSDEFIYHKEHIKKRYTIYTCKPEEGLYRDNTFTCKYIDDGYFTYGQSITTGGEWLTDPSGADDPINYIGDYEGLHGAPAQVSPVSTQPETVQDFFTIQEHFTAPSQDLNDNTIKQCGDVFNLTFHDEVDDNIKKFKPIVNSFTKIGKQYHEEACHYDCEPGMEYVKDTFPDSSSSTDYDNSISNNRCEYCPDDNWSNGEADSDDVTCKPHSNLSFVEGDEIPHILWEGDKYQDREVAYGAKGNYNLPNATLSEYIKEDAQQHKIYNYDGTSDKRPIKCQGGFYNGYYKNGVWVDYTDVTDIYFVKSKIDNSVLTAISGDSNYISGLKDLKDEDSSNPLYNTLKTRTGYLPKLHLAIPSLKDDVDTMELTQDKQDTYKLDLSFTNKDSYTDSNPYPYPTAMKSQYNNSIYYYNSGDNLTWTKVNIDDSSEYIFETLNDGSYTYNVIKYTYYENGISTEINYIITTEPDTLAILDDNFFNITADAITANNFEKLVTDIQTEINNYSKQHFYFSVETNDDNTLYMYTPYFNCIECSAGTAREGSTNDDVTSCPNCLQGEYQDLTGESTCNPCGANRNTLYDGSTFQTDCMCDVGYYHDNTYANGFVNCTMCPIGTYKTAISNEKTNCVDCPTGMGGNKVGYVRDSSTSGCVTCENTLINATVNDAYKGRSYYQAINGEFRTAVIGEIGYTCETCPAGSICYNGVIAGCEYGYYYDESSSTCVQCSDISGDYLCRGGCATNFEIQEISSASSTLHECMSNPGADITATKINCPANTICENGKIIGCSQGYKYNADDYYCTICDSNELCIGERPCSSQPCDRTPQSPPPCASPNECSAGIVTKCKKNSYYNTADKMCYPCPTNRITGKLAILKEESEDGTYNYYISDDDGETWTLKSDSDSDFDIENYSIVEHTDTLDILNLGNTLSVAEKNNLRNYLRIDIDNADISKCVAEEGYYVTTADLQRDNVRATQCAVNKNTRGIGKTSAQDCLAKPGFQLNYNVPQDERYTTDAVKCSDDTYKTDLSNSTCSPCPPNTNNQVDSYKKSVDKCIADAGYYIVGTGSSRSATICDAGKYISLDQIGKNQDVDSGQCIDNTFTDSGSTSRNYYSHPGLTLEQYNDQFRTIPDTNDPDYANIKSLMVPEPNKVINPEKNTYETCPTNYRNNYGDLTALPHPSAPPGGFYGLFDCIPKSGYYINSTTMQDTDTTDLSSITLSDYNTYDADDFPSLQTCTGYINNDSLSHHTYKNPTTIYADIMDVQNQTDCQYPICTLDSNTYYRNMDNKCIFDAYVEDNIGQSGFISLEELTATLSTFDTFNNHKVKNVNNIVLFSGDTDEDAYIIRNNTRNESLDDYLKLPTDRLYTTHDNFKGTRHDDDGSLQLYNDYIGDSSHYAERQFNNIMFSHEIPTNNNSISSTDEEKFNIARQNWKADTHTSGSVIFELKEIYTQGSFPSVNNKYKQYIPEHELFVKTHSISNLKHYIDNANNIYFTKEAMVGSEESDISITLDSKTHTILPYVQLTLADHPILYGLLINNKDYYIKSDHDDIHDVKDELKTLIDNSTTASLVLYSGTYKYKFFIDPVKGNFYQYIDSSGVLPPSECLEGSYTMKYGATSLSDCTWAGPGYYIDSDNVTECPVTHYRDGYTNTNNLPSDSCTPCPTNKEIDNPPTAGDTVYKHNVSGNQCVPSKGYYGSSGAGPSDDAYPCRKGTYKISAGYGDSYNLDLGHTVPSGDSDVCISCPNNKTTTSTWSFNAADCLPEPGYHGPAGTEDDATRCLGNTYNDSVGSTDDSACTICPSNKVIAYNIKNERTDGPVGDHCVPDIGFYGPTGSGSGAVHCPIGKGINVNRKTPESVSYTDGITEVLETVSCEDCSSDKVSVIGGTDNNYYECTDCPNGGICSGGKYEGGTIAGYYSQYERLLTFKSGDGYGNNDLYLYEYNGITPPGPPGEQVIDLTVTNNNLLDLLKRENGLPPYTKINDYDYDASGSMIQNQLEGEHNKPYVKFSKADAGGNPTDYYYKWYLSPKECPEGYKCTGDRSAVACPIGTYQDATGGHECTTCNSRNKGKNTGSSTGKTSESGACEDCLSTTLSKPNVSNNTLDDYISYGTYIQDTQTVEDMQEYCVECPRYHICSEGKIVGCLEGYEHNMSTGTCVQCDSSQICVGGCMAGYTYGVISSSGPSGAATYGCIADDAGSPLSDNTAISKNCDNATCQNGKIVTCTTGTIMTKSGFKSSDSGDVAYSPSDKGYYYDNDNRTCTPCPDYTYASTATPISDSNKAEDTLYNCIPNSGYYSTTTTTTQGDEIFPCPSNMFSKTDSRTSSPYIDDCINGQGTNVCTQTDFCQTCPLGKGIKNAPTYNGYDVISNAQATNCRPCNNGTGNSGEYRDSNGECQQCELGTVCMNGVSTECNQGYYLPQLIPGTSNSNQYNQCYPCTEGYYCAGGPISTDQSPHLPSRAVCPSGTTSDSGTTSVEDCYLQDGNYFIYDSDVICDSGTPCTSSVITGVCPGTNEAEAPVPGYTIQSFLNDLPASSPSNDYYKMDSCLYGKCDLNMYRHTDGECTVITTSPPPCTAGIEIAARYIHPDRTLISWPYNNTSGAQYTSIELDTALQNYYHDLENADVGSDGTGTMSKEDLRLFGINYSCQNAGDICEVHNTYLQEIT